MSLSKAARNCGFCKVGNGIYCCPRCNIKYCSSYCYKCRDHEECSEAFYREWVEKSLQEKASDYSDREQMMHILKKIAEESVEDDDDGVGEDMEDRFAGLNINEVDETVIWENLNNEEKVKFKAILDDEKNLESFVPIKQPWWFLLSLNLVTDVDSEEVYTKDEIVVRPPYPLNAKKLSELTSIKPSNCIQYNLVNILYAYAFLTRFYNCDLRDFLEDVTNYILIFSPVLSEGKNYFSLQESLQESIRLILNSDLDISVSFVKSIVNDIDNIMHGPKNAKPSTYVLCALNDIKLLFVELMHYLHEKKGMHKSLKKKILLSIKKIEYFISWTLEYESTLCDIASDLVIIMLPDLIPDSNIYTENVPSQQEKKPLIEEID